MYQIPSIITAIKAVKMNLFMISELIIFSEEEIS